MALHRNDFYIERVPFLPDEEHRLDYALLKVQSQTEITVRWVALRLRSDRLKVQSDGLHQKYGQIGCTKSTVRCVAPKVRSDALH